MNTQHPILSEKHRLVEIFVDLLKNKHWNITCDMFSNKSTKIQKILQVCVFLTILGAVCSWTRKKMKLIEFSKWLQYNKEWKICLMWATWSRAPCTGWRSTAGRPPSAWSCGESALEDPHKGRLQHKHTVWVFTERCTLQKLKILPRIFVLFLDKKAHF